VQYTSTELNLLVQPGQRLMAKLLVQPGQAAAAVGFVLLQQVEQPVSSSTPVNITAANMDIVFIIFWITFFARKTADVENRIALIITRATHSIQSKIKFTICLTPRPRRSQREIFYFAPFAALA
jgi:ethanolamine utilization microcompartment shell protein EutS